eukprot:6183314-Pleurochrysis_carterae.AAC.1
MEHGVLHGVQQPVLESKQAGWGDGVQRERLSQSGTPLHPVVFIRLRLMPKGDGDAEQTIEQLLGSMIDEAHPELRRALRRFRRHCSELVDRSKRKKRECTNVC